jgi:Mlc titration factor MtfA (ptsG expression regulator)
MFFEQGSRLRANRPDLYDQYAGFYEQDPASWKLPPRVSRKERRAKKRR